MKKILLVLFSFVLISSSIDAANTCSETVKVVAQPRDSLTILDDYRDEFKSLSGADFRIDFLNENDRRAKSQVDAATVGKYHVYYTDEANVALFARSGWLIQILDYYPKEFDWEDFNAGSRNIGTVDGTPWFAPINGGTDLLVYRTDLFEKAGLKPPTTLDELMATAKALHDPDNGISGIALRGLRGSGANVWRWMPYFRGFGGEWFEGNKPVFNSDAAVRATETYLELFNYSAPGTRTGSWDESTGAFLAGQVAMLIESSPLAGYAIDPGMSSVVDVVSFMPPPSPLTGGGFAHGLSIGAKANPDDASRNCAALFIAWATSKDMENRKNEAGFFGSLNRVSVLTSDLYKEQYGAVLGQALSDAGKVTIVNFWQDASWPDLGNRWGIILEELITGTRTDIQAGLDELEEYANEIMADR